MRSAISLIARASDRTSPTGRCPIEALADRRPSPISPATRASSRSGRPSRFAKDDTEVLVAPDGGCELGARALVVPDRAEAPFHERIHAPPLVLPSLSGPRLPDDAEDHRPHDEDGKPEPPEQAHVHRRAVVTT